MDNFTFDSLIKKIDIKTTPLLIALDVALIIAKFHYHQESLKIVLSIIGISIYLFLLLVLWAYKKYSNYLENKSIEQERHNDAQKKNKVSEEIIWNYFLGLTDDKLQNLVELVKLPAVPNERNKRIINANSPLRLHFTHVDYNIPIDLTHAFLLLHCIGAYDASDNLVVIIQPYFLSLLEKYIETGDKKRV